MITDHAYYWGHLWHQRQQPVKHAFRYPFWWLWINLDDIDGLLQQSWLWGRRWRPLVFCEQDYLDGAAGALSARVRTLAAQHGFDWRAGAICLMTQPRLFGLTFNPISLYWHFPDHQSRPDGVLAEVHNTPWNERHWYPLPLTEDAGPWHCEHDKVFHVSPFMALDMRYRWQLSLDARSTDITISNVKDGQTLFTAGVHLERQSASGPVASRTLRRYGAQSLKALLAIYAHAFRLWCKGVPFVAHPERKKNQQDRTR